MPRWNPAFFHSELLPDSAARIPLKFFVFQDNFQFTSSSICSVCLGLLSCSCMRLQFHHSKSCCSGDHQSSSRVPCVTRDAGFCSASVGEQTRSRRRYRPWLVKSEAGHEQHLQCAAFGFRDKVDSYELDDGCSQDSPFEFVECPQRRGLLFQMCERVIV